MIAMMMMMMKEGERESLVSGCKRGEQILNYSKDQTHTNTQIQNKDKQNNTKKKEYGRAPIHTQKRGSFSRLVSSY